MAHRVSAPWGNGRVPYRSHQPAITSIPLALAGLYAVYVPEPASAMTHIYYCEPATRRCSCGAPTGSCSHIVAAVVCPTAPSLAPVSTSPRRDTRMAA